MSQTEQVQRDDTANLPSGWATAKLTDLVALNPGLDRCFIDEKAQVAFVPMAAVDTDFGGIQRPESRTYAEVKKGYTPFISKDVIFAKITPCMENGKGGVVPGEDAAYFGSTEFHVLRPNEEIPGEWIARFLSQQSFRRSARLNMKGSAGQLRVPKTFLEEVEIPLPPRSEQIRILDRIDELFTDLDAGVAALERVRKKLPRYRAALLHAAVTGRLTEDWRAEHGTPNEDGPTLLQRIIKARREGWEKRTLKQYKDKGKKPPKGWQSRYKEPATATMSKPKELPDSWGWAINDQLVGIITSGSRDWKPFYNRGNGTFIMAGNVKMGRLDLSNRQQVGPPENHRDRQRSQVQRSDLLVTIVGANTGDVCSVDEAMPEHYVCQSVALMRPVIHIISPWLVTWFTSDAGAQGQFREFMYGAGRPHLGFDHLEGTHVALPPIEEQLVILERVQEKLSQIDAMAVKIGRGIARAVKLRQAILKSAFAGKLTHQDPSAESAPVLLERLRAQSENLVITKKKVPRKKISTKNIAKRVLKKKK